MALYLNTSQSTQTPESPDAAQESPNLSDSSSQDDTNSTSHSPLEQRSFRVYTRPQLLELSKSPLVKPPPEMPELKVWFGTENENVTSKKDEPSTPTTVRERRFRRDAEDGDAPTRPTFRSTLQPSQMGNFKHQSLRDREKDGDKERERDIRDKEGQERLRHLSDKYDRERLLPLSSSRNKERDAVPHLASNGSRAQQPLPANGTTRRGDARDSGKKKIAEGGEDWRREPVRSSREEQNGKRDRDDRERARSRVRDSSRPKREASQPRKERDRDDRARERDDHRRERDDDGDARHWRDDGKRDERMAVRRERDRARNGRDRDSDDRRWPAGEERDGRYKRAGGRDKPGDDSKDRDDRREKEKEPAWMDAYIPTDTSSGILGGQAANGELDGIQAWKKGLKEKETKDKEVTPAATNTSVAESTASAKTGSAEKPMDEIQLFRMMMKKEEEKKHDADAPVGHPSIILKLDDATLQQSSASVAASSITSKSSLPSLDSSIATIETSPPQSIITKDTAVLTSTKIGESPQDRMITASRLSNASSPDIAVASRHSGDIGPNAAFPPAGSRVLAMTKKGSNPPLNLQSLNGGLQSVMQEPPQVFAKNEQVRPPPGFSPFDDGSRLHHGFDDLQIGSQQPPQSQRLPLEQLFNSNANAQVDTNFNNGSLNKGSRLAKIFESKGRELPGHHSKPQGGYASPPLPNSGLRELGSYGGPSAGPHTAHSVEELVAMLNNSSHVGRPQNTSRPELSAAQRNNLGHHGPNPLLVGNANFNSPASNLHSLQQQHLLQQQQQQQQQQQLQHHLQNPRLEPLYDSRVEDRSFVPDGMVPGLRTAPPPPPRGRDVLGHFNEGLDEPMHYNLQRLAQQQQHQGRNIDPLFNGGNGPLLSQQLGRHGGGLPLQSLQQPLYRGGPSPALNQGNPPQQRLPPGLANLGGRPPHDPSQFIGLPGPQHNIHNNGHLPQQHHFNNFNTANNIGLNNPQARGPIQNALLQNAGGQQIPLGNLGHPNLDPRLSNHHQMMGLGGSGIGSARINGYPQQAPNAPNHLGMRPHQQHQQPNLLPHILPHLMPPHMQQQGHSPSNNPQNHELMALLMGGPHRE